ncbi:TPA: hypothetical protein QDB45_001743 [Burkholderia vietnamiensis]|nr:hypothetical protein [Burkholderia vietnamiensis]
MRKTILAAALIAASAFSATAAQAASVASTPVVSMSSAQVTSPKVVITPMKVHPTDDPSYSWNATSKPFNSRRED